MSKKSTQPPISHLINDNPSDTIHQAACVIFSLSNVSERDDALSSDEGFGLNLILKGFHDALEYESNRVIAKEKRHAPSLHEL